MYDWVPKAGYGARSLKVILNFRSREPWATLRMATRTGRTRALEHETGKGNLYVARTQSGPNPSYQQCPHTRRMQNVVLSQQLQSQTGNCCGRGEVTAAGQHAHIRHQNGTAALESRQ